MAAGGLEIACKKIFHRNRGDKNDDSRDGIIGGFGGNDFLDGFDDDMDAGYNYYNSYNDSSKLFDSGSMVGESVVTGKLFTYYYKKTGN